MKESLKHFWRLFCTFGLGFQLSLAPTAQAFTQDFIGALQETQQNIQKKKEAIALQNSDVSKYPVPDELKLGCSLLPTQFTPTTSCQAGMDPQALQFAIGLFNANAQKYAADPNPGLSCLEENSEQQYQQLYSKHQENLKTELKKFKIGNQQFLDLIKEKVKAIQNISEQLTGGPTQDYTSQFSDHFCQQTIRASEAKTIGSRGGLIGIQESLSDRQNRAQDILKPNYFEAQVEQQINTIFSNFQTSGPAGVANYQQAVSGSGQSFGSFANAYQQFSQKLNTQLGEVATDLKRLNYDITADQSYEISLNKIQDEITGSNPGLSKFKNQYLEQCLVKNGLYAPQTREQSQSAKRHRNFFKDLLRGKHNLQQKGDMILQRQGLIRTRYPTRYPVHVFLPSGRVTTNWHDYFKEHMSYCESDYSDPEEGRVYAYDKATAAITKGRNLLDNFKTELSKAIEDKVLRCAGLAPYNRSPTQCSEQGGVLDSSSPSFCKVHAQECSEAIQSCSNRLEQKITDLKTKRKSFVNEVNQNISTYRANLNQQLLSATNLVKNFNALLQQSYKFLGPLKLNEDEMFIASSPSDFKMDLGNLENIDLMDEGDPEVAATLFEGFIKSNINDALEWQKNEIRSGIQKKITEKGKEYSNASKMWREMAHNCSQIMGKLEEGFAQSQEQGQENLTAAREICAITSQANSRNCNQESLNKLTETFEQLSVDLKNDDNYWGIQKFKKECGKAFGQDPGSYSAGPGHIVRLCELTTVNENKDSISYTFNKNTYIPDSDIKKQIEVKKEKIKSECIILREVYQKKLKDYSEYKDTCTDADSLCIHKDRDSLLNESLESTTIITTEITALINTKLKLEKQEEIEERFGEIDVPLCGPINESSGPDTSPSSYESDNPFGYGDDTLGSGN